MKQQFYLFKLIGKLLGENGYSRSKERKDAEKGE